MPNEYKWAIFFVVTFAVFTSLAWAATKQRPKGYDLNKYHEKRGKR